MSKTYDEIVERNKERFEQIEKYIEENKDNIYAIITSPEINQLYGHMGAEHRGSNHYRYKGVRIIVDEYMAIETVRFIHKDNGIRIAQPCICGKFKGDEGCCPSQELK